MLIKVALIFILPFLLSGCFRYCPKNYAIALIQTDLEEVVQEAVDSGLFFCDAFCDSEWWHFFGDSQLDRLIEVALVSHPDIHMAEARVRLAENEAKLARSTLLPHFFFGGDYQRQKISELGVGFVPGFPTYFNQMTIELATAVYELDIWQKNRSHYFAALDFDQAAIAGLIAARLLLSTSIAAVYFDLMFQCERLALIEERIELQQELEMLASQRMRSAVGSAFPVLQSDITLQNLLDRRLQLINEIDHGRHTLAALVGNTTIVPDGQLSDCFSAQFGSFPLPSTLPIDLIARRPDITSRRWIIEAMNCRIKVAEAEFLPRIDLMGYIGFQSIFLSQLFVPKTLIGLADAALKLPLFLAGKLQAKLGIAHEEFELAVCAYNQNVLNAVQEVSDALSDLVSTSDRLRQIERAVNDAHQVYTLAAQKYESAIFNKLDYLVALDQFLMQKDSALEVQLERYVSAVGLILSIGGGYCE